MRAEALILGALPLLLWASLNPDPARAGSAPDGATIGDAAIVLPGFSPLGLTGRSVRLGAGREYLWGPDILPALIESRGRELVGPMQIAIGVNGVYSSVGASSFVITASAPDHVDIATSGMAGASLKIDARIRIEYDGLATVDLQLTPVGSVHIDGVEVVAPIIRTPDMRLLGFVPETLYNFGKQVVFPLCTDLPYRSAVGFTDTERSFWLLTDEPAVPSEGTRWPTRLDCDAGHVHLRQPLLPGMQLDAPVSLSFAFLATPVRDLPGTYRRDRVIAGLSADDASVGNRQLWWVEALPHYSLPYTDYPPGARARLDAADLAAYPGLSANRRALDAWRRLGIQRVPYVSLRAPSALDPVAHDHVQEWRILPPQDMPAAGDGPYRQGFARPLLSHRAPGFSDYWLYRLDRILTELPVSGFYFDQAEPVGSANPLHLPADARIRPAMASDILATRSFLKRLATTIYQHGRTPLLYVHNSMAPVIPAYTFATAMVQGEEFNTTLRNFNYQMSTDLELLQATYTNGASGVPVIWLEEVWSDYLAQRRPARYRADLGAWLRSREYAAGLRNFMSLALLHDVPVWTMAPASVLHPLFDPLDRFGIDGSAFTGYWKLDPDWRSRAILVSLYARADGRTLAVIVNRGTSSRLLAPEDLAPFASRGATALPAVGRTIGSGDFLLVETAAGEARK